MNFKKSSKGRINYEPNSWNKEECEYKCNNINNQDKIENPRESKKMKDLKHIMKKLIILK